MFDFIIKYLKLNISFSVDAHVYTFLSTENSVLTTIDEDSIQETLRWPVKMKQNNTLAQMSFQKMIYYSHVVHRLFAFYLSLQIQFSDCQQNNNLPKITVMGSLET